MNEAVKFLEKNPVGGFATVLGNKPNVRPFQFMFEQEGKLFFCTSSKKSVYQELIALPYASFTCYGGTQYVRLDGHVQFIPDLAVKAKIIEENPLVKSIYKSADNPDFQAFYFDNGTIALYDLTGGTPKKFAL